MEGIKGDVPEQGCMGVNGVLDKSALMQSVDLEAMGTTRHWHLDLRHRGHPARLAALGPALGGA
jgi:hypothetical protein